MRDHSAPGEDIGMRQWRRLQSERLELEAEIERLQSLIDETVVWLTRVDARAIAGTSRFGHESRESGRKGQAS